jgi:hypothetical protein
LEAQQDPLTLPTLSPLIVMISAINSNFLLKLLIVSSFYNLQKKIEKICEPFFYFKYFYSCGIIDFVIINKCVRTTGYPTHESL